MTTLPKLLYGEGVFANVEHILEDLSEEQAKMRLAGVPHSLYEELWHVDFWQHLALSVIRREPVVYPERAAEGWPDDNEMLEERGWQDLRNRFLLDLEEAAVLAGLQRLEEVAGDKTIRGQLESIAGHNAYHFGRMVFLRQLLGLWPPPSGGDTW